MADEKKNHFSVTFRSRVAEESVAPFLMRNRQRAINHVPRAKSMKQDLVVITSRNFLLFPAPKTGQQGSSTKSVA